MKRLIFSLFLTMNCVFITVNIHASVSLYDLLFLADSQDFGSIHKVMKNSGSVYRPIEAKENCWVFDYGKCCTIYKFHSGRNGNAVMFQSDNREGILMMTALLSDYLVNTIMQNSSMLSLYFYLSHNIYIDLNDTDNKYSMAIYPKI